jgi:hypothetical protein
MKRLPKLPFTDVETVELVDDSSRDLTHVDQRMHGIDVPVILKDFDDFTRERWLNAVELMMTRGIETTVEIAGITDLSNRVAGILRKQVIDRWAQTMTRGALNQRREKLYVEADRVKAELWRMYEKGEREGADFKEQLSYLKMIVDTGARQAKLCGLEALPDEQVTANNKDKAQITSEAEARLQLPSGSLEMIGKTLAEAISKQKGERND